MKTYNQFLNTPFSEEIKPPEPPEFQGDDTAINSKEKRQKQIKKQVLLKKLQAVRAGSGADIVAGYEPEGEVLDEADPRLAIYQSGMTDASRVKGRVGKAVDKIKDKVKKVLGKKDKVSSHLDRYRFQSGLDNYLKSKVKKEEVELDERLGGKGYSRKAAASSVYPGKKGTGDWEDSDRGKGNKAKRRAGEEVEKKSPTYRAYVLNKEEVVDEGIKKSIKKGVRIAKRFVKDVTDDDPGRAHTIGSLGNPHLKNEGKRKKVSEETIDESPYGYSDREFNMLTTIAKHPRGSKVSYDKKGKKVVTSKDGKTLKHKFDKEGRAHYGEATDKAFEYVKKQIAAKYGKSGYVSKDNPRKPQTAAEKKKVAAHKAKLAKQDHRDPTEKASDGRYSDRHSNRGSD